MLLLSSPCCLVELLLTCSVSFRQLLFLFDCCFYSLPVKFVFVHFLVFYLLLLDLTFKYLLVKTCFLLTDLAFVYCFHNVWCGCQRTECGCGTSFPFLKFIARLFLLFCNLSIKGLCLIHFLLNKSRLRIGVLPTTLTDSITEIRRR